MNQSLQNSVMFIQNNLPKQTVLSGGRTALHHFLLCFRGLWDVKFSSYWSRQQLIMLKNVRLCRFPTLNNKNKKSPKFQHKKHKCRTNYFWSTTFFCVWCLNHVGPTLTGCRHWSWYETVLDFNRHNPPDDLSSPCIASNIDSSEATHGWAVMYGSLFISFCLFIPVIQAVTLAGDNKWAEISVISPSTGTLQLLKSGGCLCTAGWWLKKHKGGWWKWFSLSNAPHLSSRHVRAGETRPWAISDGVVRKDEHTHASYYCCCPRGSSRSKSFRALMES